MNAYHFPIDHEPDKVAELEQAITANDAHLQRVEAENAKLREQAKRSDKFREQLRFKLRKADEINAELMSAAEEVLSEINPPETPAEHKLAAAVAKAKAEGRK